MHDYVWQMMEEVVVVGKLVTVSSGEVLVVVVKQTNVLVVT